MHEYVETMNEMLNSPLSLRDSENSLAVEIRQEMASAYFAACRKMVDSLEALKAFDCAAASCTLNNERRSELLDDSAERVLFVLIQREAMKLSGYDQFFEDYAVPDDIKRRLGTKRSN